MVKINKAEFLRTHATKVNSLIGKGLTHHQAAKEMSNGITCADIGNFLYREGTHRVRINRVITSKIEEYIKQCAKSNVGLSTTIISTRKKFKKEIPQSTISNCYYKHKDGLNYRKPGYKELKNTNVAPVAPAFRLKVNDIEIGEKCIQIPNTGNINLKLSEDGKTYLLSY